jgi:hypothetical protein
MAPQLATVRCPQSLIHKKMPTRSSMYNQAGDARASKVSKLVQKNSFIAVDFKYIGKAIHVLN